MDYVLSDAGFETIADSHKLMVVMANKEKSSSGQLVLTVPTAHTLSEGGASIYVEDAGPATGVLD